MPIRTVLVLALAAVGCSKDGPATETTGPVQCGPGTELVDGRCVATETPAADPDNGPAQSSDQRDLVGEFEAMADELCRCPDRACAEAVSQKLSQWVQANNDAANDLGPDQQERAQKIGERLSQCMVKLADSGAKPANAAAVPEKQKKIAAKVVAMFEAAAAVMKKHADDCDKMAAGLRDIAAKNKAVIDEGKKIDSDKDPNFRTWFDETYGKKLQELMAEGIGAMMKTCGADEGVKEAMGSLTGS